MAWPPSKRCDYLAVANASLTPPRVACQIETHCEQLKIALAAGIVARGPGRVIDRRATTQKQQLPAAHGGSYLVCRMRSTHTQTGTERERDRDRDTDTEADSRQRPRYETGASERVGERGRGVERERERGRTSASFCTPHFDWLQFYLIFVCFFLTLSLLSAAALTGSAWNAGYRVFPLVILRPRRCCVFAHLST